MRFLIYLFWVLPPVALSFLAVMMSRRKLNTRYPFFCSYVAFQILDFAAQFAVYHVWPQQYYYEYFAGSILSICLSFAVIYELFTQVFEPFDGLRDLGGILFRWAALVLIVAATLMAITSSGMPHVNLKTALILSFERSVRVM